MSIARKILMGAAGAGSKSTYVDDVFSTYLYKGTGSPQTITNGIDLAGEGGMTWIKSRNWNRSHNIYDTVRGTNKVIYTESTNAEVTKGPANQDSGIYQFNNNGFNIGAINGVGASGYNYSSWTFRKAKGFCDVVSYTGNGSNRNIAHNLGCRPGMIIIKDLDDTDNWEVYHKSLPELNGSDHYYLILNTNTNQQYGASRWNNTAPTASSFRLGQSTSVNQNGSRYIAYVFAGGQSDAATARSANFNGSSGYITVPNSSDLDPGSGDFTVDFWFKVVGGSSGYYFFSKGFGQQIAMSNQKLKCWFNDKDSYDGSYNVILESSTSVVGNQWNHAAVTRSGNTFRLFLNGNLEQTSTVSFTVFGTSSYPTLIGAGNWGSYSSHLNGKISNFRYIKGQALYTTSFRPSNEPSTTTSQGATSSNVKLLCCNNSSVTGATVTPGTLTANSGATASIYNPFQDPGCFKFGEEGDQSIIKTGMYKGNGSTNGPEVYLGWEPQYVLVKNTSSNDSWRIFDSMRGIVTGGDDALIHPNSNAAEYSGNTNEMDLTPTGFKIGINDSGVNGNGYTYIYTAIRRSDGYVGKPPEAGTDVFAMDTGAGTTTIPNFDSGFPVDYASMRDPSATSEYYVGPRLMGRYYLIGDNTNAQAGPATGWDWDSNVGYEAGGYTSSYQSWMWKRHAGFDVVCYTGTGVARMQSHSLGRVPEMIWVKRRNGTHSWYGYHKGINGGVNPQNYTIVVNGNGIQDPSAWTWNNTAPNSTAFSLASDNACNGSGDTYLALLFASVEGICKVGYYAGNGQTGASGPFITLGFTPRFVIIKNINQSGNDWWMHDSLRGMDKTLAWDNTSPQITYQNYLDISSTGFRITSSYVGYNASGDNYIYYAHA